LLDGARLTRRGVDVAAVVWESFEVAARNQIALQGLADIPLVLVPDQTPQDTEADQRRKGLAAADALLDRWRDRTAARGAT
jgi:hypothetical protein